MMNVFESPLSEDRLSELHQLATAALNENLSDEQAVRLDQLVCQDEEFRKQYIRYMYVSWNLRTWAKFPLADDSESPLQPSMPTDVDEALLRQLQVPSSEPAAPSIPSFLGNFVHGTVGFFSQEVPFAMLTATIITSLGLLAGSFVYVSHHESTAQKSKPSSPSMAMVSNPQSEYVGRITGMVDVKWSDATTAAVTELVALDRKYALASGLMEITYDTGAKVILQGPCTYQADSRDGGFLSVGRLTVRVEKRGESGQQQTMYGDCNKPQPALTPTISHGDRGLGTGPDPLAARHTFFFAIRTPTTIVTDLGTEFGVDVDKRGTTTSHVFRGSVRVQVISRDGKVEGRGQVLHDNESAYVERSGENHRNAQVRIFASPNTLTDFVREFPRPALSTPTIKIFDLVDVVAGGDGYSGRRNAGIDPTNGRAVDSPPPSNDYILNGDEKYHRVSGLPFVDGVFIPGTHASSAQVDSAGHRFADFNATVNHTYGYVWAGGTIPLGPVDQQRVVAISTKLNGIDYATSGHGLLFLHANKGITFDLDSIRCAHPGDKLVRFRATAGNTETFSEGTAWRNWGWPSIFADLWVLVDGQPRFRRREINGMNGGFAVNIPLGSKDHFLTLVAVDAGNDFHADWIIFGDPRLEFQSESDQKGGAMIQNR